ncbi:cobalt-precorrin-6A reductase [Rhodobium gokarnense]|uniref:Precorrin-6A/cobalt-precorrin-6A reductase n=1 Tax=Rhodobium gokarnense TaxID=364296 RepID=A0ABT3H6N3_9HYPH|nr:cobalt-precorrin-6A reductase [Rhodobium gokarnense]MCW2306034.1 precorrin-6A/cobalt-precorrin-6A reductase [Rhodobium gokarnense]
MQNLETPYRVLILGGTTEASELARSLAGETKIAPVLSLAGRTKSPKPPPIPYRVGGFGGIEGLKAYLHDNHVEAMVDATHPFAAQMTDHAAAAAKATGVPLIRIDRPAWRPEAGDRWISVGTMAEAAKALGPEPRRVFLTIGRNELAAFRAAPQHHYLTRSVDPPDPETRPPNCTVIEAVGPFKLDDERALIADHGIEMLVTKNAGGTATAAKLTAAREAGIPVVMVERPPLPEIDTVPDAAAALSWLMERAQGT